MSLKALREDMEKKAAEAAPQPEEKPAEEISKVATARGLIEGMNRDELVELFGKEAVDAAETEQSSEVSEDDVKVAEDLYAAGQIMAKGFKDAFEDEKE